MRIEKNWKYGIRIAGITLLAFLLSRFIIYDISSISYFSPMERSGDFSISDFYQTVANEKRIKNLEDDIVIVSIDSCGRNAIGNLIEAIDFCNPAAVGLDVFFNYPSSDDSLLIESINGCSNLVLPCSAAYDAATDSFTGTTGSFFYGNLKERKELGAVNLAGNTMHSIIREFRPFFICGKDTILHFATALARMKDKDAYERLLERGNTIESVNYPLNDFHILTPQEVLEYPQELENKIVLIGSIQEQWDHHITPVSARMPGIVIHAHSIATILQGTYIRQTAGWIVWSIAILLCIGILMLNDFCEGKKYESLLMRLAQLLLLYAIVVTGYHFFRKGQICIDFSIPLLMVGLVFLARDLWTGGANLATAIKEKYQSKKDRV